MKRFIILQITFFLVLASASIGWAQRPIVTSRVCQKDLQIRIAVIRQDGARYTTIFYKQDEELVAGRFADLAAAETALDEIQKGLEELEWKCRQAEASYLYE